MNRTDECEKYHLFVIAP
jgi:hypothetical protein